MHSRNKWQKIVTRVLYTFLTPCDSPNCRTVQIVAGDNLDRLFLTSAVQFVAGILGTPTVQIVAKSHFSVFFHFMFLHLLEIVERSYFHCSLSVYVCFCLSVCVSVSEHQPNEYTDFNAVFAKRLLIALA